MKVKDFSSLQTLDRARQIIQRSSFVEMNITILQRNIRRYFEVGLSRSSPRRALLLCGFIFLVFLYLFLLRAPSEIPSPVGQCIIDQFAQKYADFTPKINSPSFIGNGFIGVDASLDRQLLVSQGDDSTLKLPIYTAFRPLVDVSLSSLVEDVKVQFVSDYREGMSRAVQCSVIVSFIVYIVICLKKLWDVFRGRSVFAYISLCTLIGHAQTCWSTKFVLPIRQYVISIFKNVFLEWCSP